MVSRCPARPRDYGGCLVDHDLSNTHEGVEMSGRGKKITDSERSLIVELYTGGVVMRQIAVRIHRSYGAVNLVLHQEGVPIAPRGGYHRAPK